MVTIKRVDILSAMKVAALLNALVVTVVGVLFFACNSLIVGSLNASISGLSAQTGGGTFNPSSFAMASLAGCLASYVIMVLAAAVSGAIFGALYAFFYNVISNWAGGLRVELVHDQVLIPEKAKRPTDEDEFRF
jgi:hypothetical protein